MNRYRSGPMVVYLCGLFFLGIRQEIYAQTSGPAFPAQPHSAEAVFTVVPLGVRGGLDESNLSAYMVAPAGSNEYICLDAGTLYAGIRKAIDSGTFTAPVSNIMRSYIKAYFISHSHLDHVAGLIINSPDDSAKTIFGLPSCLEVLKDKYFTWSAWANFGDEGEKPLLKKYHYAPLSPGEEIAVPHTALYVEAFPLSHGAPYESTAFLVRRTTADGNAYLLYLGDTGADTIEHSDKLHRLWSQIAPLVKAGQLKAVFIETSFPDEQPQRLLFGHLTPKLLRQEMADLESLTGKSALTGLPVVITHRKPSGDQEALIQKELEADHTLPVKLIFPQQGKRLNF